MARQIALHWRADSACVSAKERARSKNIKSGLNGAVRSRRARSLRAGSRS